MDVRTVARGVSLALAISTLAALTAAPAHAAPKYSFSGGTMYTIEYHAPGAMPGQSASKTRFGKIDKSGKVTALSRDLGLGQVTDADYSPATGLIYVLANAYSAECEVWSFEPKHPNTTLVKIATLTHAGYHPATCKSLAISHGTGFIMVALEDDLLSDKRVDNFDATTGNYISTDGGFNDGYTDDFTAMDFEGSNVLTFNGNGNFDFWGPTNPIRSGGVTPGRGWIHSVKFDGNGTPWVLAWGDNNVVVGKLAESGNTVTWGSVLKDKKTNRPWYSDTLVFVPKR